MTAVERLEAAIAKLEQLKAFSTPGEWYRAGFPEPSVWAGTGLSTDLLVVDDARFLHDADLIVTLHRTIDAQIWLLRLTSAYLGAGMTGPDSSDAFAALGVALADAILGDNS